MNAMHSVGTAKAVSTNAAGLPGEGWSEARLEQLAALITTGLTYAEIGERMGMSSNAISNKIARLRATGDRRYFDAHPSKPGRKVEIPDLPADFVARAAVMTNQDLRLHYRRSEMTISRWLAENGIDPKRFAVSGQRKQHLPDNFASLAPRMTQYEAKLLWGVSENILRRWCAEAGVTLRRQVAVVKRAERGSPLPMVQRDMSRIGQVVDFLRKYSAVYRCDKSGRPAEKGQFWNRGGYVLTDEDLVQRASRLGFDPDAWRRIAA